MKDNPIEDKTMIFIGIVIVAVVLGSAIFLTTLDEGTGIIDSGDGTGNLDDVGVTVGSVDNVVDANNLFAIEYYSQIRDDSENIFFSPYSISTALAMVYEGAEGKTAKEMANVFHFPEDENVRRPAFAKIYNELNKENDNYTLSTANALWAQNDYAFLETYTNTIETFYGGKITNLDFVGDTENSRITINKWVEDQTNDKITDLIPQGFIRSYTRLVLTNAIYFKGKWVEQFDEKYTKDEDFKTLKGKTVKVPMMRLLGERFKYAEVDDLQVIELPYEGDDISMLILLPEKTIVDLERDISVDNLEEWKNRLSYETVDVYIPKFTFETKYFMAENLKEMGMPTGFSSQADFSGMDGTRMLFIDFVIHQAFVEVNEEGTEAAAATGVGMALTAVPLEPKVFRADHPFVFIIQQRETGNILFMGRVIDPSA